MLRNNYSLTWIRYFFDKRLNIAGKLVWFGWSFSFDNVVGSVVTVVWDEIGFIKEAYSYSKVSFYNNDTNNDELFT